MKPFNPDPDLALLAPIMRLSRHTEEIMKRDDAIHVKRLRRRKALQVFARQKHYDSDFLMRQSWPCVIIANRRVICREGRNDWFTNSEIHTVSGYFTE
jgi:hypothetical protein